MFHETPRFPDDISWGSQGGPGYNTTIIETDSGGEQRISRWANARRRYDVSYGVKSRSQLAVIVSFFVAREGAAFGFRFKDFVDFTSASDHVSAHSATDCYIGVGDGLTQTFQLQKKYVSGSTTKYRAITKPVSGTILAAINGTPTTLFTVDTTKGEITFDTAPGSGTNITAGFEFDVPVRFDDNADKALMMAQDGFDDNSVSGLSLIEIKDSTPVDPNGLFNGGACETATHVDYQLNLGKGRVQAVQALATGLKIKLPDPSGMPGGGPIFIIINEGSNAFDVTSADGSVVYVSGLAAGYCVESIISVNGSGVKNWYVF